MDVSKMKDGDVAGLAAFQGDAALLSIVKEGKRSFIVGSKESVALSDEDKVVTDVKREEVYRQALKSKVVYLKMSCDFRLHQDLVTLSYSVDGKNWVEAIRGFKMIFDYRRFFMGTRIGIYREALWMSKALHIRSRKNRVVYLLIDSDMPMATCRSVA